MKKISLKEVKDGLKRDEMRMVLGGGSGNTMSFNECTLFCFSAGGISCDPTSGGWLCRVG